jgi:glucose-1-phosphate thymidylyltransferase
LEANRLILETAESNHRQGAKVDAKSRLEGRVVLQEGAVIEDSVIRGPVIVGPRSRIVHSYLGPFTAVYHDVTIEDSELEHSIVLEHAKVRGVRPLRDSLIGQRAELARSPAKPAGYRFMLGDSSRVEVP